MTRLTVAMLAALALLVADARGYEAQPTHAGLTERAAAAARLHDLLSRHWGRPLGLYEPLRWKAPHELAWRLGQLDPMEGLRPDEQGENTALGWLLAGAVLEDVPPVRTRHHFFDPQSGRGLSERGPLVRTFFFLFGNHQVGGSFDLSGRPTPEWAMAPGAENDLGLGVMLDALEQSAVAPTASAREEALAHALLAMGALAHLIEDMGAPAHVRNDFQGEHMQRMPGSSPWDQRSLYEHYVALRYGRLGVPVAAGAPTEHAHLRDHFTALAGWVRPRFFSAGTLPREMDVRDLDAKTVLSRANRSLRLAAPQLLKIDPSKSGVISSPDVPVLLSYVVEGGTLRFTLDERVHAAYARLLLPRTVRAAADVLAFLSRGRLVIAQQAGGIVVLNRGPALARGTLQLLTEDGAGRRRVLAKIAPASWPVASGGGLGRADAAPAGVKRIIAVFRGEDGAGEPLVAVEDVPATAPATTSER